ncbi:hypothetical protein B296_00054630 [Ensete ventricosum]|uniref:BHLH domain-containing protein n=1 Tax=Ensete ventricosum TaxID=4639 RepID=A0A426Y3Q2_ENSVE|nr:hypothetical protein B296_00054630 [Ensete ventricosum]
MSGRGHETPIESLLLFTSTHAMKVHWILQASASKLLKETCSYIKSLHREVDGLSDQLSGLMATMDSNSPQADIIRSLLRS